MAREAADGSRVGGLGVEAKHDLGDLLAAGGCEAARLALEDEAALLEHTDGGEVVLRGAAVERPGPDLEQEGASAAVARPKPQNSLPSQ